ncbi:hypothetical protein DM02DRAFT_609749 [Periconia macrospinosa]|uniref:Uncharacterized protein n=1 Tax=Periconia macrospinosa TaxID=97972 RepID=A0A2V1E7H8_9PLEO|nr:hypothetical protein DM02DRAFT_609749 [Periconia macrospinosa]
MRRAETKIGLLKEVIEKVQRDENVDVGKLLGAGDASEEAEWAQVLKEIEEEERLFTPKKSRIAAKKAAAERPVAEQQSTSDRDEVDPTREGQVKVEVLDGAKFY